MANGRTRGDIPAITLGSGAAFRLVDTIGVRRLFIWGVGVFSASSLLRAMASNIHWLVAGRALQAVGASLLGQDHAVRPVGNEHNRRDPYARGNPTGLEGAGGP